MKFHTHTELRNIKIEVTSNADGLFQFNYDRFAYQISEDISLVYKDGEICGSIIENKSDIISITDNKSIEIIKLSERTE